MCKIKFQEIFRMNVGLPDLSKENKSYFFKKGQRDQHLF